MLIKHTSCVAGAGKIFAKLMELHIRLAQCGLVHCDFNEFNVMISDNEEITLIDFPQVCVHIWRSTRDQSIAPEPVGSKRKGGERNTTP